MSETITLTLEISTLLLEFFVTFVGVFLAFVLDRIIDKEKEQKARKELLRNLMNELKRIKDELTGEAKLLYPDIYDSAVSSGKLDLLNMEQLTKLTNVYRKIKQQEYETMLLRDKKDVYEDNKDVYDKAHNLKTRIELAKLSNKNEHRETALKETIEKLLEEQWLNAN
jgi:hypothetical protein